MSQVWKVHKFGGTSVLNADRYKNVSEIVLTKIPQSRRAVVVSAMKGVTDDLIRAVEMAAGKYESYRDILEQIKARHHKEIETLLKKDFQQELLSRIDRDIEELAEILRGVVLVRKASESIFERCSGMGEVWSAQILSAYFQQQGLKTSWLDAREIVTVSHSHQRVNIDWEKSQKKMEAWLQAHPMDLVTITGFVAATEDGSMTTLGRNGSDYSASIFGALLKADEIYIWTDVDGVLSADPRLVPEAVIIDEMSYHEMTELAYFGAKVVHPSTMAPAISHSIPIWIKNSLNPTAPGTKIHKNAISERAVKGFSTIDKMSVLNLEGTGMVGIPGVAERFFGALRSAGVSVVLISQASSEQSICIAIPEAQSQIAKDAVTEAFASEIQRNLIQQVQVTDQVSILAAVGDKMAHSPGVAGRFFTALGRSSVNVRAIAQGSSERNISAVIDSKDAMRALRTVHSSFVLPHQTISLGMVGLGLIGGTFLKQLQAQLVEVKKLRNIDVQVRALANSKKMYLSDQAIDLSHWQELFVKNAVALDLDKLSKHLRASHIPHSVIVEATASEALTPHYAGWLRSGLHIISPNKKANSGSLKVYQEIRRAAQDAQRHFLYSTNVGAGLPIVQTLRDLVATGDKVVTIQGIFSGTLSYIFNNYDGTEAFSEIVKKAKEKGYTEPDPREDLSGQDVMRKLVILAREEGLNLEPSDVIVEGLVPEPLQKISTDEFMKRLTELDAVMSEKMKQAKAQKQILRFVGTIDANGKARVGLEVLPESHAFARVSGTDNVVLFKTQRYFHQPLVIQGPGAGPEVTAAGVFADLLRLSQYLGVQP
jgi:aspartokinase/homoserine dehydrogenase 1